MFAERKGELAEATVKSVSKKKADHWALKFTSDGKLVPKPLDSIKIEVVEEEEAVGAPLRLVVEGA